MFSFKERCLQSQDLSSCCTCLADASWRNPALHFPLDVRLHFKPQHQNFPAIVTIMAIVMIFEGGCISPPG